MPDDDDDEWKRDMDIRITLFCMAVLLSFTVVGGGILIWRVATTTCGETMIYGCGYD